MNILCLIYIYNIVERANKNSLSELSWCIDGSQVTTTVTVTNILCRHISSRPKSYKYIINQRHTTVYLSIITNDGTPNSICSSIKVSTNNKGKFTKKKTSMNKLPNVCKGEYGSSLLKDIMRYVIACVLYYRCMHCMIFNILHAMSKVTTRNILAW